MCDLGKIMNWHEKATKSCTCVPIGTYIPPHKVVVCIWGGGQLFALHKNIEISAMIFMFDSGFGYVCVVFPLSGINPVGWFALCMGFFLVDGMECAIGVVSSAGAYVYHCSVGCLVGLFGHALFWAFWHTCNDIHKRYSQKWQFLRREELWSRNYQSIEFGANRLSWTFFILFSLAVFFLND